MRPDAKEISRNRLTVLFDEPSDELLKVELRFIPAKSVISRREVSLIMGVLRRTRDKTRFERAKSKTMTPNRRLELTDARSCKKNLSQRV